MSISSGLDYVAESAETLTLTLVRGNLDMNQFKRLSNGIIELGSIRIHAQIIGASHVLSVSADGLTLHEVFACCEVETTSEKIELGPLKNLSGPVKLDNLPSGMTYEFKAVIQTSEEGKSTLHNMERIVNGNGNTLPGKWIRVMDEFPVGDSDHEIPKTVVLVNYNKEKETVTVKTAHSYPNEKKVVLTETVLKRAVSQTSNH